MVTVYRLQLHAAPDYGMLVDLIARGFEIWVCKDPTYCDRCDQPRDELTALVSAEGHYMRVCARCVVPADTAQRLEDLE